MTPFQRCAIITAYHACGKYACCCNGGMLLVLHGGLIRGGQVHGTWPGLAIDQLDNRVDLAIIIDYRAVLTERMGNTDLASTFPGFSGTPLDLFIDPATLTNKVHLPAIHR